MPETESKTSHPCRPVTHQTHGLARSFVCVVLSAFWIVVSSFGCASHFPKAPEAAPNAANERNPTARIVGRPFERTTDSFGYTNNNLWLYEFGPNDEMRAVKSRLEEVEHGQRCTIMARTARQFFYEARFDPDLPKVSDHDYRDRIRQVIETNPRNDRRSATPISIPGYSHLREFSLDKEELLKETIGGRSIGYFQRGNWRMIMPFSPNHQRSTADELRTDLSRGHLPLVHIANFPAININHTGLVFGVTESPTEIRFEIYDPNSAAETRYLVFDRASAAFRYSRTNYFAGGTAKIYRVYDGLLY